MASAESRIMEKVEVKQEPSSPILDTSPKSETPVNGGGKRKAREPKHLSELEKGTKEPHVKKSKKEIESNKYKAFIADNKRYLKKEPKVNTETLFQDYKEFLQDPEIIKAYCLKYFYFLDKYSVKCERMLDFEDLKVECNEAVDKIAQLKKLPKDVDLKEEDLLLLEKKFGYSMFKIPKKDKKWVQRAIDKSADGTFTMRLVDLEVSAFKNKEGNPVACIFPVLRYE